MSIGQVSKKFQLSAYTLRFWEKEGIIPPVHRNASGIRDYTHRDMEWVLFSIYMRRAGVNIKVLRKYITLLRQGPKTKNQRKQLLKSQLKPMKKRIKELNGFYKAISWKVKNYDWLDRTRIKRFGQL